jgi:molybdopterin converting factor small subunit
MRQYAPEGKGDFALEVENGTRVGRMLERLGVPSHERPFIAVNGLRAKPDRRLSEGDTVVLFTPAEGG